MAHQFNFISHGALAQLGARNTGSVEVRGSNPLCSTIRTKHLFRGAFFVLMVDLGRVPEGKRIPIYSRQFASESSLARANAADCSAAARRIRAKREAPSVYACAAGSMLHQKQKPPKSVVFCFCRHLVGRTPAPNGAGLLAHRASNPRCLFCFLSDTGLRRIDKPSCRGV